MRKYLNTRTGNVIEVPCPVSGPDWEEVTEAETAPKEEAPKTAAPKKRAAPKRG